YYIIEAKVNNSAKKAIEQINKKYLPQFSEDDEIVKIGINWNKKGGEFDVVYEK
ncbi:hypothetical protein VAMP_125n1, partial [Candidatus Vampirococcus lugosii]|nr:hypothetical protein [Candidatus Vampirococcus lugosii]